jgi:hypothetical protein
VPAQSLGGIRLGDTPAHVRQIWGRDFGVCRGCPAKTWYFTYRRFDDEGAAVEFTGGRVSALYTLSQPDGWTGPKGMRLGVTEGQVTATVGPLTPIACAGYTALVQGTSVYYIVGGKLWAFGLVRRGRSPCR